MPGGSKACHRQPLPPILHSTRQFYPLQGLKCSILQVCCNPRLQKIRSLEEGGMRLAGMQDPPQALQRQLPIYVNRPSKLSFFGGSGGRWSQWRVEGICSQLGAGMASAAFLFWEMTFYRQGIGLSDLEGCRYFSKSTTSCPPICQNFHPNAFSRTFSVQHGGDKIYERKINELTLF